MDRMTLRAETAPHDELARLLRRLSHGRMAFRAPRVVEQLHKVKTRSLIRLLRGWRSIWSGHHTGSENGGPSGDWQTPTTRGFAVVFLTFVVFGGWAAPGSIVVESDRKTVQHLEGGIVQNLMVTGVAHVEQGQVLLRLDATQERAKEEMARSAVD